MDKKKTTTILLILIILLLSITGTYFLFFNKTPKEESGSNQTTRERETIAVEQGELFTLESEKKAFYLPKGWTSKKDLDENFTEYYTLEGDDLSLTLKFLPVENLSQWSKQENVEYSTPSSRLYKDTEGYKAIFNLGQTRIEEDFENNTRTEEDYGLFLIINKNDKPLENLTIEDYSYIKFILDSFDQSE